MNEKAKISAILLAAGSSARFGAKNKLLQKIAEQTILQLNLAFLTQFDFREIVLVGSPGLEDGLPQINENIHFVINHEARSGMASSIKCGIAALKQRMSGLLIHLADKPFVKPETVDTLMREFVRLDCQKICVPVFNGQTGHPVIFPAKLKSDLLNLTGDTGGRNLLAQKSAIVHRVQLNDAAILKDINTMNDLNFYRKREERNAT